MKGGLSLFYALLCLVWVVAMLFGWQPKPDHVAFVAFSGAGVAWLSLSWIERNR